MTRKILNDYLSCDEAAAELSISRRTLYRWSLERKGPPFARIGRRRVYNSTSLREWLQEQERKPLR